ncbi:MAG: hypothetical protein ACR2PX_27115 [Endozoicomonas sp.]|uniref:hypothetical protein n=1 Tax=Endozoicomonas sp. TaxID=1892382 RepID=UPI003D9B4C6D
MKAVHLVLHGVDLESDTFFELCKIDLKAVSPGTTRVIPPKEVYKHVLTFDEQDQARLEYVANRIVGLASEVGQRVMSDRSHNTTSNPYDNALRLLAANESDFRKAEEIRYVEYHRGHGRMWDGYYLTTPVPLDKDVDLTDFVQKLRAHFNNDKLVVRRQKRQRHSDHHALVTVLQFIIYREGLPVSFEVLDEEGKDVILETIHPAREYAVTYEPETGVIELYADQKAIRDVLKQTFCEAVLDQEDSPEKLKLRPVNLEIFRQRPNFEDSFELKFGIKEAVVKEIDTQVSPGQGITVYKATPRKAFRSDAYQNLDDNGVSLEDSRKYKIRSVTLAFHCEATDDLPEETIVVRLSAPNSCSLRDLSQRERYLNHDLLVQMGVLLEDKDKDNEATSV